MPTLLKDKLSNLPKSPGVYLFKNTRGKIFYIGKAINLRNRVKNHFSRPTYWDKFFIDSVSNVDYIKTNSDIEALLLESQLIKKHKPRYNIMLRDDKQYFYVGFSRDKLPIIEITHQPKKGVRYIGPFTDGGSLKIVLRYLRKVFPYYTKRHRKLPCSYCHIDLCPGPEPNITSYKKDILKIKAILRGQKPRVISALKKEMRGASYSLKYEKAAKIKRQIEALENIFAHRSGGFSLLLSDSPRGERIFGEKGVSEAERARWSEDLRTERGRDPNGARHAGANDRVLSSKYPFSSSERNLLLDLDKITSIEAYDISNIQGKEPVASMVRFENGKPNKSKYRKFRIRLPEKPNDVAMMKEVMRRRLAHKEWPYPDLFLIDGGRGQLNAALEELKKYGLKNAAGLAKRFNELYIPRKSRPIPMDSLRKDLKHTLMYARDEAHRFAISYHRKLHRKKSML